MTVTILETTVTIPTYAIGAPDKNPMFLEKRVYQGSSGVIYPYPLIESVTDEKQDRDYQAIILENRYLKIMLLPQLGGRVQMALDKTNDYHFIYYNRVIKPALVGLTGPWISGGIEFNWPQHHRPSTFEPVDYRIDHHADGSKTVWFSELERMFRTKGMAGFTLYPDRAYLEIRVQLYNPTPHPQTFLWWANPAVHVNDDYQSVFPPDVHAVMDHGKRDVSSFPIAKGVYYKVNYAPGTDISRYKNIPVPTSFMAYHSDYDFIGCYDHGRQAGMLHVANHHIVPGKKQWTWGNGEFGRMWDRQLTDEDGPYIELMCGAYTDNQPDFSWLQPGEEKAFTQIFMPYKQIGPPKNASRDAVVNLEIHADRAALGVYVTQPRLIRVTLTSSGAALFDRTLSLDPQITLRETVALPNGVRPETCTLSVWDADEGRLLVEYTPETEAEHDIPAPASAAKPPGEIASVEELFLNGLHLEQYRHATYAPEPYYEEGLRRDPEDSRCNNALGLLLLRRGKFAEAEAYFRRAVKRLTLRNPNPYDGEPYYNLGLALIMQRCFDAAFDALYKAAWNAAWRDAAYFELARIASRRGDTEQALDLLNQALERNTRHHQARHLKIALLRRIGQPEQARDEAQSALRIDRFNYGALWETHLLTPGSTAPRWLTENALTAIEVALAYIHAGCFDDALTLLDHAPLTTPMVRYYAGWAAKEAGEQDAADRLFAQARQMSPDYCFPNEVECVLALDAAMQHDPTDARAPYYLGNFWYAHRRYEEAIAAWERAADLDPAFPTVFRNLGLAYMNKRQDAQRAWQAYERAFALDPTDARVLFELDQLARRMGSHPHQRLERLRAHLALVRQRDDLTLEYVTLLNVTGQHQQALDEILSHTFHPWEGGEGKVSAQYVASLLELSKAELRAGADRAARALLERAVSNPPSLGEGRLTHDNHIAYFLGIACARLGETDKARACFERAASGSLDPKSPMYYNDQPPDMIFYQGLALSALGRMAEARACFERLIDYGHTHLNDVVQMDYFAVSLPDFLVFDEDLTERNRQHCQYMLGLGYLGLGQTDEAVRWFDAVLSKAPHHLGAALHRHSAVREPMFFAESVPLTGDR
jgi:tetratricopeptide (TPR) repeat protein